MANHHVKYSDKVLLIVLVLLLILFSVNLYRLMNKISAEQVITSGANVTKLIDVADIKRRMEFHGCLVCWKDSTGVWWFYRDGVWWFYRDGEQCKLWSSK